MFLWAKIRYGGDGEVMLATLRPAWAREEAFERVPDGFAPYGFIGRKGQAHEFLSFDELKKAIREDSSVGIGLVWTPDKEYLVPPEEVPELYSAVKSFRRELARDELLDQRRNLLMFGAFLAYSIYSAWSRYGWQGVYQDQLVGFSLILTIMMGGIPLYEAYKLKRQTAALTPEKMASEVPEVRFSIWLARQPAPATKRLLVACVVVGVSQLLDFFWFRDIREVNIEIDGVVQRVRESGALIDAGLWKPYTGDWGRLLTAPFVHGGVLHFIMNYLALKYLGSRVEILARWPHLLGVFLLSILGGGIATLLLIPQPSVGASGGICGLLGFLLIFETHHRELVPKSVRRRLFGALIGLVVIGLVGFRFIDNAAHAGGLVTGLAYAWVVFPESNSPLRPAPGGLGRIWGMFALLMIVASVILCVSRIL